MTLTFEQETDEMANSLYSMGQRGKEVLLDRSDIVVISEYNIRSDYGDLEGEDLASIKTQGIKNAILGFMKDGKFIACDGNRRLTKYDYEISQGMEQFKIPVKLDQRCETQEGRVLLALEMSSGKQLSMMEQASGYQYLRDESGYTLEAIAKAVGKSRQHVHDCLTMIEKAPEAIQAMVSSGSISPTEALRVFREDGEDATELLQEAVEVAKAEGKVKATAKHVKAAKVASEASTVASEPLYDDSVEKSELADFLASVSTEEWMTFELSLLRKLVKKLSN